MKIKYNNIIFTLFIIALFILEFAYFTQNVTLFPTTFMYEAINISLYLFAICAVLNFVSLKAKFKVWLIFLIIVILSALCTFKTNDNIFLQLSLISFASLQLDFKKIIKYDLVTKILIFLFIYFCFISNFVYANDFFRAGIYRYTFGFKNPNALGFFILITYFEYMYIFWNIKNNKIKPIDIIVYAIVFYILNLSGSRSAQISMILFAVIYMSFLNKKISTTFFTKERKYELLFVVFMFFSMIISYRYDDSLFYQTLNKFLSNRLYIQNFYLNLYNITFLGNKVDYVITLDNSFIRLILNFGVSGFIVYFLIFKTIFKNAYLNNDKKIIIIFILLLIYGLMEWYIIRPGLNIFLLYFSTQLQKKVKEEEI